MKIVIDEPVNDPSRDAAPGDQELRIRFDYDPECPGIEVWYDGDWYPIVWISPITKTLCYTHTDNLRDYGLGLNPPPSP